MKYVSLISLLFLVACDNASFTTSSQCTSETTATELIVTCGTTESVIPLPTDGADGEDGDDAVNTVRNETVVASRNYGPSVFNPTTLLAERGYYQLPDTIDVVLGNAGTGWASILVGDDRYCYQGTAANNSQLSSEFEYDGVVPANKECFQVSRTNQSLTVNSVFEAQDIVVSVHGGGCGPNCTETIIEADIILAEFNKD